jgi:hypothetical protein
MRSGVGVPLHTPCKAVAWAAGAAVLQQGRQGEGLRRMTERAGGMVRCALLGRWDGSLHQGFRARARQCILLLSVGGCGRWAGAVYNTCRRWAGATHVKTTWRSLSAFAVAFISPPPVLTPGFRGRGLLGTHLGSREVGGA